MSFRGRLYSCSEKFVSFWHVSRLLCKLIEGLQCMLVLFFLEVIVAVVVFLKAMYFKGFLHMTIS